MTDKTNGPPKEDRPPEIRKPINSFCGTPTSPTAGIDLTGSVRQARRRRVTSWRLPVLECRLSDPWFYPEPGDRGYAAAAHHLLELGLTPAPNLDGLRLMWRRSGRSRQAAGLIAQRWGMAA
jgi:hypothetical protein